MRVLFDVSHPAHVHLFKHAVRALSEAGHAVRILSREKEVTTALLDAAGLEHTPLSAKGDGPVSLLSEWVGRELRVLWAARRFDPDVVVSRLNPAAVHAARLTGARSIVFHDTEAAGALARFTLPLADVVCTPGAVEDSWDGQRRYDGYQELAYLHPNRFSPDAAGLAADGVAVGEPYSVLRLVAGDAHHDYGNRALSAPGLDRVVDALSALGPVYASVEDEADRPDGTEPLPVAPERLHDLLACADCYVGDSNTTAVEAGLLGTPAIRYDTFGHDALANFVELESSYGLVRSTDDEATLLSLVESVTADPAAASERWARRRNDLLAEKIDVTGYMLDLVELEGPS